ncbi:ATPase, F0 complex, subunit B/B', bacterial/chloroplast [Prunus dulcis]|uniref:ATPase, F0 complex, subunit B/B', bacterial/chloroplast n=1 Tax=Prunus dulcis TaxID=3755 RepID=A0A4Y1QUG6_PRUDU|nr:ATPase, F0 complex, subunit B/B', bacterial/chloroplast [Prunus dulcis]
MSYSTLKIDDDDFVPVRPSSVERPRRSNSLPFVPLLLIDGFSRKSFSYSALPQEPLRLSVLKLDGSCFDIEVAKTATVLELKQAVEAVFSHMPQKGPGKISWPHVWGHFCLCYGAQKLVVETDHIRHYGIKDGDQGKGSKNRALVTHNCVFHPHLAYASYVMEFSSFMSTGLVWYMQLHFVRHVSISYTLTKKQSKKGLIGLKQNTTSIPRSISLEEIEAIDKEEEQSDRDIEQHDEVFYDSDDIENPKSTHCNGEVSIEHNESTLPSLLGEWFPYSKLSAVGTTSKRSLACAPSIATGLLVGFRKMFGLCFEKRDKRYSRRDTWRID